MSEIPSEFSADAVNAEMGEQAIPGHLRVLPEALLFESESANCGLPFARLQLQRDISGRILCCDPEQPEWRVSTRDESLLQHPLLKKNHCIRPQLRQLRQIQEGWRNLRLASVFLALLAGIALGIGLLSSLALTLAVHLTPLAWERALGQSALRDIRENSQWVTDPAVTNQVYSIVQRLATALPGRKLEFRLYIIEDPTPNAMALPGGIIVVCQGLLDSVDRHEQTAAVLAHEMVHVTRRHALRSVIAAAGPYYVLRLFISDQRGLMSLINNASQMILCLNHSRELERQADDLAFHHLMRANIDPRGGYEFFEKIHGLQLHEKMEESVPVLFRSHPPTQDRIEHLRSLWEHSPRKSGFLDLTREIGPLRHSSTNQTSD